MLKHSKDEKAKKDCLEKFFFSFNNWFRRVTNSYSRGVAIWIRRWPYIIVLLAVIFVGLFFLFKAKPTGFIPQEDEGRLYLTYELPEGCINYPQRGYAEGTTKKVKRYS